MWEESGGGGGVDKCAVKLEGCMFYQSLAPFS